MTVRDFLTFIDNRSYAAGLNNYLNTKYEIKLLYSIYFKCRIKRPPLRSRVGARGLGARIAEKPYVVGSGHGMSITIFMNKNQLLS